MTIEEARTVFDDPHVMIEGQDHALEPRLVALGYSARSRILVVIVAEVAHEEIRIISARRAERHERGEYEDQAR